MRRYTSRARWAGGAPTMQIQSEVGGRWGGTHLFASFIRQYWPTSKSLTSLAILAGTSHFSASKRVT